MLFIALLEVRSGTQNERMKHAVTRKHTEELKIIGEYWTIGNKLAAVVIAEADDPNDMLKAISVWDDIYNITVIPAISRDEGIKLAQKMGL